MIIGNKTFDTKHHGYIMGILNVTPDSFSDGGKYDHLDAALKHADEMVRDGAAIIDVGGESTRPGYTLISDEEEIARVTPVIEALKKEFDVPVSLDTYKSGVAKAGIEAGADLINDIWGLKWDGTMAAVLAETGVASCLMHNRKDTDYKDYLNDVVADLDETMKMAKEAGIKKETIMLDPGIGFAKDLDQNLELMNHLELLNQWDVPVLLGTSRKSMIGLTLDLPSDQRVEGTVATTYFHDHHNLFVAGSSPDDMLFAVNRIRELQGGFLTVKDGRILSELALPVCGLLSEKSIRENGLALKAVRKSLTDLGYVHNNPIMSVATLGLPVSPALKLTDKGLVDVKKGEIVPLIVNTKKNK